MLHPGNTSKYKTPQERELERQLKSIKKLVLKTKRKGERNNAIS